MGLQLEFTQWEFTSPQAPADGVGGRVAAGASEDGAGPAAVAQRDPFKRVIAMPKGWDTYRHVLRQLTPISQRNHPEGMAHHPVYPCHPQRALPRAPGPEAAAFYREPSLGEAPCPLEPVAVGVAKLDPHPWQGPPTSLSVELSPCLGRYKGLGLKHLHGNPHSAQRDPLTACCPMNP